MTSEWSSIDAGFFETCPECNLLKFLYTKSRKDCRTCERLSVQLNWANRIVYDSRGSDKKKGWDTSSSEYIDSEFVESLERQCTYCSVKLVCGFGINRKRCRNGLTIDRISNDLPHLKTNVHTVCSECNGVKGDSYTHEEMLDFGPYLKSKLSQRCYSCKDILPTVMFHRRTRSRSGYDGVCKMCSAVRTKRRKLG